MTSSRTMSPCWLQIGQATDGQTDGWTLLFIESRNRKKRKMRGPECSGKHEKKSRISLSAYQKSWQIKIVANCFRPPRISFEHSPSWRFNQLSEIRWNSFFWLRLLDFMKSSGEGQAKLVSWLQKWKFGRANNDAAIQCNFFFNSWTSFVSIEL